VEISNLPLAIKIIREPEAEGSEYVAYSPEFDLSSCGATVEEARGNLREAIGLVIESCAEDGTLDQFLEDVGFRPEKKGCYTLSKKCAGVCYQERFADG